MSTYAQECVRSAALIVAGLLIVTVLTGCGSSLQIPGAYTISGKVTGAVNQGVTMTLGGAITATTMTDANGNYTLCDCPKGGLPDGNYVVTPVLAGYTFSPADKAVTLAGANITSLDFTSSVQ